MQLDRLTIGLSWVDSSLMPNRKNGRHWGNSQAAKVKARQEGYMVAKSALHGHALAPADTYPLRITFAAPDGRHRDLDNLLAASKPAIDGIAQALGVNDKCFRPIVIDAERDARGIGVVRVEIGA